jgi:hypothetical protein
MLGVEASLDRVFQPGLKTGGGATTGGARGTIVELRRRQAEDGRVDTMDCVTLALPFSFYYVLGV